MQAQVAALITLELEKNKDAQGLSLSRKMQIEQRKNSFKTAADRRGVGFIMDLQFDLVDFQNAFSKLLDDEENIKNVADNAEAVVHFLKYCISFGSMINRKLEKEYEAYSIANNSRYGWSTEKYFRQESVFSNSGIQETTNWFDKDEISAEEKVKKFRNAEKQASFAAKQKRHYEDKFEFKGGNKRAKWDNSIPATATSSYAGSDSRYTPQQMYYPQQMYSPQQVHSPQQMYSTQQMYVLQQMYVPPVPKMSASVPQCYNCWQVGHIQRNCPTKGKKE